ncbi:MAG: hypothetical protein GY697_27040, partial [Desulfobacterales bacterium]|nr:hypothetical protein [Desulfobacterales bacterium]
MGSENDILKDFDFSNFDKSWAALGQNQKNIMLESISELKFSEAVLPIIAGLSSYHYLLRSTAREALNIALLNMNKALKNKSNKKKYLNAIQESDCFASKFFFQITKNTALAELNYYFQNLIKIDGKGPFYAWRICSSRIISKQTFKTIIQSLSDREKLKLTEQYLQGSPQTRREWALEFKRILTNISNKECIIDFLSDIFDDNKDIDPFLINIPLLNNKDQSLFEDLYSSDSLKKEQTLKAIALIQDSLDVDFMVNCLKNKKEKKIRKIVMKIIEYSSMDTYSQAVISGSLLDILKKHDAKEAFSAFKALVIARG